jgi:hypothetical protein
MTVPVITAAVLGPILLAIAFAVLLNRATFQKTMLEAAENQGLIFIAGIIAVGIGATIIKLHNVWVLDWPLLVTLTGWLSLAAGFFRMIWPNLAAELAHRFLAHEVAMNVMAIVAFILGATLVNVGFF